jgi:endonuclease/exonuclease/phosphatase family metal-dependent hydrolase
MKNHAFTGTVWTRYHFIAWTSLLGALVLVALSACHPSSPSRDGTPPGAQSPQAETLIVCTYNIHIGKGMDGVLDLERIARVLTDARADVAALQEVDRHTRRSNATDQLDVLKRLTGFSGVFDRSIDFMGGEYGLGTLSRGAIIEHRHALHPVGKEEERRGYQLIRSQTDTGKTYWILNTHLGLVAEDRLAQIQTLLDAVSSLAEPVILAGDFNEIPNGSGIQKIRDAGFLDAAEVAGATDFTWPADVPQKRIDYIWIRAADLWNVRSARVVNTQASDHLPLVVELQWPE